MVGNGADACYCSGVQIVLVALSCRGGLDDSRRNDDVRELGQRPSSSTLGSWYRVLFLEKPHKVATKGSICYRTCCAV